MKKILTILLALLMVLALAGCAKKEEKKEETPVVETTTASGNYFVTNNTGKNVGGVYIYTAGSADKGTNYVHAAYEAGEMHYDYLQNFHGITIDANDDAKFAEWTGPKDQLAHFVFEFTDTDGNTIGTFENLALESATIVLIAEDARTGATQIAWGGRDIAEYTMTVDFYNMTAYDVTSLKVYNSSTKELVADVLADLGLEKLAADDLEAHPWSHSEAIDVANTIHYDVEWVMSNGETLTLGVDDTHALSFENTAMQLLNKNMMADYNAGATCVVWLAPFITPVTPKK